MMEMATTGQTDAATPERSMMRGSALHPLD